MVLMVVMQGQAYLSQMVLTSHAAGCLSGLLNSRQQKRRHDPQDRDRYQQFDDCKSGLASSRVRLAAVKARRTRRINILGTDPAHQSTDSPTYGTIQTQPPMSSRKAKSPGKA